MKSRIENLILLIIFLISGIVYFWKLDHGTPNWTRTLQVFRNKEEIEKYIPKMVELREKYYQERQKFIDREEKFDKKLFKETFGNPRCKLFEKLPEETILNCSRGYLLGVVLSDEQHTLAGITSMDIKKLDFNPDMYVYGGFYFYTQSAMLVLAKILGIISLNTDIKYYFLNPDEIARMYIVLRSLSAISSIFILIILYFLLLKFVEKIQSRLFTIFIFMLNYLFIYYTHLVKPHLYGAFFVILGIYFCYKLFVTNRTKYYFYSGAAFGFATSVLFSNALFFIFVFLIPFLQSNFNIKNINFKSMIQLGISFFLPVVITNHYVITNFRKVLEQGLRQGSEIYGTNYFSFIDGIKFLYDISSKTHLWLILPIIVIGYIIFLTKKDKFSKFLVYISLWFFFWVVFYLRHIGPMAVWISLIPVFFGVGIDYIIIHRSKIVKLIGKLYFGVICLIFIITTAAILSLYVRKGNITVTGRWINENVPPGTSIGVPGGWFLIAYFPPFNFLQYELVHFPLEFDKIDSVEVGLLPEYVVINEDKIFQFENSLFNKYYTQVYHIKQKPFWVKFFSSIIPTENKEMKIYKLKH